MMFFLIKPIKLFSSANYDKNYLSLIHLVKTPLKFMNFRYNIFSTIVFKLKTGNYNLTLFNKKINSNQALFYII